MAWTVDELVRDLRALGVGAGDCLWVHSSLRSIGAVQQGPAGVVEALLTAIGPRGTLLMPAFNLVERSQRAPTWRYPDTPSTTGYLTEFFRMMPGTVRSDHYSHSVAARGAAAAWFVGGHRDREGPDSPWDLQPWGKTYGSHSPLLRMLDRDAQILMLGVDYHSATFVHVAEVLAWNERRRADPAAEYEFLNREVVGAWWDRSGNLRRGRVGSADCRLIGARQFVQAILEHRPRSMA